MLPSRRHFRRCFLLLSIDAVYFIVIMMMMPLIADADCQAADDTAASFSFRHAADADFL